MSIGIILLIISGVLIYFGIAQRVLDKLYLNDITALLLIIGFIIGSFYNIPISDKPLIYLNIGGAVIPILLAIYILFRAGTSKEIIRTLFSTLLTATGIYTVSIIFKNYGEGYDIIDPMFIFALLGGIFAYIFGRSRRGAFVSGVLGFLVYDLFNLYRVLSGQINTHIRIGSAGAFDSIIISGIIAVLLAELIGETREKLINKRRNNK